ncbi:S-methyl-5'-thioadenosine phosphorylase [subsurface metagenome]
MGSLKEEIHVLDLVIPDQLIDRTKTRISTFFGGGLVGHIAFAEPFCPNLSRVLFDIAQETGIRAHQGGTYVAMEGPQFSTRAESELYRSWGGDVIGMTVLPEAKLAREAEICYSSLSFVTDYDCWRPHGADKDKQTLLKEITANLQTATNNCMELIKAVEHIPGQVKADLEPLLRKYMK